MADTLKVDRERRLMPLDHQVLSRLSQGDSIGQNSPSARRLVRGDRAQPRRSNQLGPSATQRTGTCASRQRPPHERKLRFESFGD